MQEKKGRVFKGGSYGSAKYLKNLAEENQFITVFVN